MSWRAGARRCALAAVGLLAAAGPLRAGEGPGPNLAGVQIWNCDYWQTYFQGDFIGPNYQIEKLKPIALVGTRNGSFSGYVVLTNSGGPLRGLKAKVSDLSGPAGAKIPADQVKIRYPELAVVEKSWAPPYRFDGLVETPPEEVPTLDLKQWREWRVKNEGPVAMQPVWVTVRVPKNAAPGDYQGKLTIQVENPALKNMEVAIQIKVQDWVLPDPKDFSIQNLGWLSPERVAQYYRVPIWSAKHFELMGNSLELMQQVGSRQVTVNLVLRYPSQDNSETMVKWVKQPDGSFKYDFSAFDRYMDLVAKKLGKPFPVRLNMWSAKKEPYPPVAVVDPAGARLEDLPQPPYGSPEALAFWKPVLDELRVRMEHRKWFDVTGANWIEYCGGPDPKTVSMFKKIWPDGKWTDMDHGRRTGFKGEEPGVFMPVLIQSCVWNEGDLGIYERWDGQQSPGPRGFKGRVGPGVAYLGHARGRFREHSPLWVLRVLNEEMMMRGDHGVDPVGADLWPVQDANGRYSPGLWAAFALGPGNCTMTMLAPGPNGAIATERFEALREGVQICEAMLCLQRALEAGKLSGALAERANKVLDDRARAFMAAYQPPAPKGHPVLNCLKIAQGAPERESELFATAAEVAKALGSSGPKQ